MKMKHWERMRAIKHICYWLKLLEGGFEHTVQQAKKRGGTKSEKKGKSSVKEVFEGSMMVSLAVILKIPGVTKTTLYRYQLKK